MIHPALTVFGSPSVEFPTHPELFHSILTSLADHPNGSLAVFEEIDQTNQSWCWVAWYI
jgi:hypothetical protein